MAAPSSTSTAAVPPAAASGFTNHGMRTLIATAPLNAPVLVDLFRELRRPETTLTGLIVLVFASWCDCCQQFVEEYNRMAALVPTVCRTAVAWMPDTEVLALRAEGAEHNCTEAVALGNGVKRLPAVFFVNTAGHVELGTMYTSFEPIVDEYLLFNETATAAASKEFWPELAAAALGVAPKPRI